LIREDLQGRVAQVTPALEPLPEFGNALLLAQRLKTVEGITSLLAIAGNPMFKGYPLADYRWWPVFYYRFVNPESRMGPHLNYADRIRNAEARVLPLDWVVIRCPARSASGL
jgi:hypothetical protein